MASMAARGNRCAIIRAIKPVPVPISKMFFACSCAAQAPKSNSSYNAINSALEFVKENPTIEVPTHLRSNHPDKRNYKYPHSFQNHWVKQSYHPKQLSFFESSNLGYEKMQNDYLDKIRK